MAQPNPEAIEAANNDMRFVYDTIHELHDRAVNTMSPESVESLRAHESLQTLGAYALQFEFRNPYSPPELQAAARELKKENGVDYIPELTIVNFHPPSSSLGGSAEFFLKAIMSDQTSIRPALGIESSGEVAKVNGQFVKGDPDEIRPPGLPETYRRKEHDTYASDTGELLDPTHNDEYRGKIVRVFKALRLQESYARIVETTRLGALSPLDAKAIGYDLTGNPYSDK